MRTRFLTFLLCINFYINHNAVGLVCKNTTFLFFKNGLIWIILEPNSSYVLILYKCHKQKYQGIK